MTGLSVRLRLLLALAILAVATLTVGVVAWVSLTTGNDRLERLLDGTLTGVDGALDLSRQSAALATLAPYLLTLDSPFRIVQDGETALALVDAIDAGLPAGVTLTPSLADTRGAIRTLLDATTRRAELRDRILRLNADLAKLERRFAARSARETGRAEERRLWLELQGQAAALLGAVQAENLIGVGEYQRAFVTLMPRVPDDGPPAVQEAEQVLHEIAEGPTGVFELRRLELASELRARGALVRIRQGASAVTAHAAEVTQQARDEIAAERSRTVTAIALAKSTILVVGLGSAALALVAALFVSKYVTANLHRVSEAMMRLASGDRKARLPRTPARGDEIGRLFHAFRVFRANAIRLDRSSRHMVQRTALLENMMQGISDGVAILSDSGTVVTHNQRLARVLRVKPDRLAPRPDLDALIAAAGWETRTTPGGYATLSGHEGRVVERRESPLPDGGSVVLLSDVTERRQVEDRLQGIQRIEALGKVSGELAHDFGNILSTISGNLHLMQTAPPARQETLRQTIASAVDLGMSITGRLLSFARRQHLEPETVDLASLVDGLGDLVGFALREDIVFAIETTEDPLPVRVDPGQIESAILNLCLNAGQAIEGAGAITLAVFRQGDTAVLEVRDSGAGMSPDVLAHAMEPFFTARADGTGTGLGLAMVYGFIRQSGGDIHLTSAPGQGTTVRLVLPLWTDRAAPPPGDLPPLGSVVLVEDDPADRLHARRLLSRQTTDLTLCPDALSARERVEQRLDLLVSDLTLHGQVEGWALARACLERWPDARAIVVSGRLPPVNPLAADFPGRIAMIAKPLTEPDLSQALESMAQPSDA